MWLAFYSFFENFSISKENTHDLSITRSLLTYVVPVFADLLLSAHLNLAILKIDSIISTNIINKMWLMNSDSQQNYLNSMAVDDRWISHIQ